MFLEGADQIQSADSPEAMYARRRAAHWILNMAEESPVLDTALFRCVHWICGSLRSVLEDVERRISTLESRAGRAAHHAVLEELGKDAHHHVEGCSILADEHPYVCSYCWEQIQKQCRHVAENRNVSLAVEYIVAGNELNRVFGLDEDGIAVCEFAFILQHFPELKMYFAAGLGIFGPGGLRLMAQMLSMSQDILSDHLGMLLCFGILEYDKDRSFHLIPAVSAFWSSRFSVDASFFCSAFKDDLLPLKSFRVPGEEVRHVCRLLKEHVDFSVNILLYGPSVSGKKTFAHSLAKNIGMKVCLVSSRGKNSEGECRASFLACLHRASLQKGTLIVVDGAERLLSTDFDVEGVSGSQRKNTADMIFAFEKSGQKIVWITDDVEKIEPSVRRRFIYSIHFESLGVRERVEMWRHVLKRQGLSRRFDKSYMTGLAMKYPVQAEVVQSAIIQASSLYPSGNRFYTALDRILKAHLALQHGGRLSSKKVYGAVSDFTLNGVCMEENISVFMERCQRMDAAMRSGKVLRPGCGTMLFYGPPGTGKTALARFVAETLNRECIVKRASDLLSPFVGVSEQQVAEVFGEMEKNGAVLVIDEVDSFLYSRDGVHHSWEITLVNEFLTSLEECHGFCICTTNRREYLDKAAMRRFSYKLKFCYADFSRVKALYRKLLAPLCKAPMSEALWLRLSNMRYLTPGDFHAVRAKYDPLFTKPEEITHELLVQALSHEMSLKMDSKEQTLDIVID